jgi:iron complex outermembrane receptor protein
MRFRLQPVALAASTVCLGLALPAFAQTPAPAQPARPVAAAPAAAPATTTIEITGIRASIMQSIAAKQNAATNVEVITAEDVGKMPDKNIADALSRLPGLNVQFGGALAMDEAERIAIRGTSPNLNLVTVNGHALSSGDWHVGDQGSSGRSVGFGLMPSQLIGRAVVYKTGQADITEGGIAGTVDVQTRKPLDFRKQLTGEVAIGAVHATLPKKTDPQLSGLIGWKNEANTFGVLVQAYSEKRHLRRDGQETFGFNVITAGAAATAAIRPDGTTDTALRDQLVGKRLPGSLNSALFEGVRERVGGYVGVQLRPTKGVDLNFSAFRTELKADNYNSSAFALPNTLITNGWRVSGATFEGDVMTAATLTRPPATTANANQRVIGFQFDHNLRQGAKSLSSFYDLEGKFDLTDKLTIRTRIGYTEGSGVTNAQPSLTFGLVNPNMSYQINTSRPTDYRMTDAITGQPIDLSRTSSYAQMSNTGASVASNDDETYFHLDGEWKIDKGAISALKFGARTAKHVRTYDVLGARWNAQDRADGTPVTPSPFLSVTGGLLVNFQNLPVYPGTTVPTQAPIVPNGQVPVPATAYPGNWASGIDANFPRNLFRFDPGQLSAFAAQYVNWDPVAAKIWTSGYRVEETNNAAYAMAEFDVDNFSGNFGARFVQTKVYSLSYQALPNGTAAGQCVPIQPCSVPGAIVGSRFASYLPQVTETDHNIVLPSLNVRWVVQRGLIARGSVSKTLGRPNYNELAGAVALNNTLLTGSSGNPLLKPITATNVDGSLAWYFAPASYVSAAVFAQDLKDYVKAGTSQVEFFNTATGTNSIYTVTSRIGVKAKIRGFEVMGDMPVGGGFGVGANATYVDGEDQDGVDLLGTSKLTTNLIGWFENDRFSARVAYNRRSDYAIGFVGNGTNTPGNGVHKYKGSGTVSLSLAWKITPMLRLTFDGNNLNNPVRSTYYITENAPGYWHQSGRQYFVNLRARF